MHGTDWLWPGFLAFVFAVLSFDLFVIHRRAEALSIRNSLVTWGVYVALALVFAVGVFRFGGAGKGAEFLTGYLVEQALSMDNIFVIAMIFAHFKVPPEAQHRVLFYGILGAIVMRMSLIVPGVHLVQQFHFIGMALGAVLVWSGWKMLRHDGAQIDPGQSAVVRLLMRSGRCLDSYRGNRFLVKVDGRLWMTPLFVVLAAVEVTDLVFAIDSIPAVLAISDDPFIVFSSNVFAIMGLRVLYFVLAGMMREFEYLQTGLSLVLVFIGMKMLLAGIIEIPSLVALGVTAFLIGGSVVASMVARAEDPRPPGRP
ncbi:MAG: tellurium resistance protein TerC [Phyllobacteriaceae bacterium]|nr:tellurium resistance protein TerC [Phyllobacteriaceae bacterium]MBA89646.1 tellurium resistance protein TerC [Phyllobacteriaceae bacterium]